MFDLSGKTALITGASGGIGQDIAARLHEAGAKVGLAGTREAVLKELADKLGEGAMPLVADLSSSEGIESLIKGAEEALGGIDILVNNAGITRDNLALRMKEEDWTDVLDVNLKAGFLLSKACLRGMMKNRQGRIINISSVVGSTGNRGQANYASPKAGMVGFTKSLAREVANRGITVNCVAPGFIQTDMTDALNEEQKNHILSTIPMARLGRVAEVAQAVQFLASDAAAYITGHTLHVNGGMHME